MNPVNYLYDFMKKVEITIEEEALFRDWYRKKAPDKSLRQIAKEEGIAYHKLRYRVAKGITVERAIEEIKGKCIKRPRKRNMS